jgi:hypothetical protein
MFGASRALGRTAASIFFCSAYAIALSRMADSSFLGADVAQMKSTLMLGPFSAETQCGEIGAATLERIITVDPKSAYRGACFKSTDPVELSARVAESASMRDLLDQH